MRLCSISHIILVLLCGKQGRRRATDAPFRIRQYHPNRSIEITHILPLDCGLQRLTYVETVFRQLHELLVSSLVLVRPFERELIDERRTRVLTRTKTMIALAVLKTSFAWEASTAFLLRILILWSRTDTWTLHVRAVTITGRL